MDRNRPVIKDVNISYVYSSPCVRFAMFPMFPAILMFCNIQRLEYQALIALPPEPMHAPSTWFFFTSLSPMDKDHFLYSSLCLVNIINSRQKTPAERNTKSTVSFSISLCLFFSWFLNNSFVELLQDLRYLAGHNLLGFEIKE